MGEGNFFCLNEFRLRVAAHGLGGILEVYGELISRAISSETILIIHTRRQLRGDLGPPKP